MPVRQVSNALDLLEFFAQRQAPATLAEISRHLGWPRSSTFNLLNTLAGRGYLYEPRARSGYYPSPRWLPMLSAIDRAEPIPETLLALLRALTRKTRETSVLAAVSGLDAVFVAAEESPLAIRYVAHAGKTVPIHGTATGRALLSTLDAGARQAILKRVKIQRHTPTTLMSQAAIEKEIEKSIRRGWFEGRGEYTEGLVGVAMPVQVEQRQFAVLVAGPAARLQGHYKTLAGVMKKQIARSLRTRPAPRSGEAVAPH